MNENERISIVFYLSLAHTQYTVEKKRQSAKWLIVSKERISHKSNGKRFDSRIELLFFFFLNGNTKMKEKNKKNMKKEQKQKQK